MLINLGYISNERVGHLPLSIKNIFYSYYKIFNKYTYRLLVLLNIYPQTTFYFDSRKKQAYNSCKMESKETIKSKNNIRIEINYEKNK